ncbi:peptide deformylase [Spongisporangium articulatum]|uniref:Peptide deformylase n=1 Tax=Spongisporangium articulatum TaxID=3362603 RepID=A0ABW8AQX1_9ACTN
MQRDESGDAFISEFKYWRDIRGHSQTRLASLMGFDRSYISKIETGGEKATRSFAERAEQILNSGGALMRAWRTTSRTSGTEQLAEPRRPAPALSDVPSVVTVEHDHAELRYDDGVYTATQRRRILNGGTEPLTRYLIRISVDRFPGDPERSNAHYRRDPLTWDELQLVAHNADGDPMRWTVQHDRDAFKEIWLLFENDYGKFPLYPGESAEIVYSYSVADTKWGQWFQRAVRLPTRRLSVGLDFPEELSPVVWGQETTMASASVAFRTAIVRNVDDGRALFSWSTEDPPLHARYRLEWSFKATPTEAPVSARKSPSEQMAALGIVQDGDPILAEQSTDFDLPRESEDARRVIAQLRSSMDRVAAVHEFKKGMGIAAPQIGIGRSAAIVQTPEGDHIVLINPRVIDESRTTDKQYEGCLSFFDVRGLVPRPTSIEVQHQDFDGSMHITTFDAGTARLVMHEIDHLGGQLYRERMDDGDAPIPVSEYKGTGQPWRY